MAVIIHVFSWTEGSEHDTHQHASTRATSISLVLWVIHQSAGKHSLCVSLSQTHILYAYSHPSSDIHTWSRACGFKSQCFQFQAGESEKRKAISIHHNNCTFTNIARLLDCNCSEADGPLTPGVAFLQSDKSYRAVINSYVIIKYSIG